MLPRALVLSPVPSGRAAVAWLSRVRVASVASRARARHTMAALGRKKAQNGSCRDGTWELHLLPTSSGAVCLDGSPAGFYLFKAPAGTKRFKATNQSWVINFEGGGWCVSEEDCAIRAVGRAGSSQSWPRSGAFGGVLSKCCFCTSFCTYNRVLIKSCDGSSFSGAATRDVPAWGYINKQLAVPRRVHIAGRAIVAQTLQVLIERFGLGHANDVLVSGCSSGGLAALLLAGFVRSTLVAAAAPLRRFKVAAFSGLFFVPESSDEARHPFAEQMRSVVRMAAIDSPSCLKGPAGSCMLGTAPLEAVPLDIPVFVVQTPVDNWQASCILGAGGSRTSRIFLAGCEHGPWGKCLGWMRGAGGASKRNCMPWQFAQLRTYQRQVSDALTQSPALTRPGSGAFVHSCGNHCEDTDTLVYTRIGDVAIKQALAAWFKAESTVAPGAHTRRGCLPFWGNRSAGDCPTTEMCGGGRLESLPPISAHHRAKQWAFALNNITSRSRDLANGNTRVSVKV